MQAAADYTVFVRYNSHGDKVCTVERFQDWRATAGTAGLTKLVLVEVIKDREGNVLTERIVRFGSNPSGC